jgi:hypothetical protein
LTVGELLGNAGPGMTGSSVRPRSRCLAVAPVQPINQDVEPDLGEPLR